MRYWILLGVTLVIFSCKTSKNVSEKIDDKTTGKNYPKLPVIKAKLGELPSAATDIRIESAEVKGNVLKVKIWYKGGCGDHDFQLIGDSKIAKSMPPIREMVIVHTVIKDECSREISRNVEFDISDFAANKSANSEIYLVLANYKDKILYTYSEDIQK